MANRLPVTAISVSRYRRHGFHRLGRGHDGGIRRSIGFPPDEALKFILPGYFVGLLVAEMKGPMPLVSVSSRLFPVRIQSGLGLAGHLGRGGVDRLEGKMAFTRLQLIPSLGCRRWCCARCRNYFSSVRVFETWDRLLRYLSYALLWPDFDHLHVRPALRTDKALYRGIALTVTIAIAYKTNGHGDVGRDGIGACVFVAAVIALFKLFNRCACSNPHGPPRGAGRK